MNIIEEIERSELEKKYKYRLIKYINFALENVFKTKAKIDFKFFQINPGRNSIQYIKYIDIKDSKKGYVMNGVMYISDWTMEQDKNVLMKIVIHELLHILCPEYSENQVVNETDRKFNTLEKSIKWKVFYR